tara:strand:+ start:284 stop:493 length:210 start_codon:yes stop_codon:yes gene_type:complete
MKKNEWDELSKYLWKLSMMKSKYSQPLKDLVVMVNKKIYNEVIKDDNKQTSTTNGNNTRLDPDRTNSSD